MPGADQAWAKTSLTRASVIFATGGFGRQVTAAIAALLAAPYDRVQLATAVRPMRPKLEAAPPRRDRPHHSPSPQAL
jgi:glutamine synthetase adenylyltransferase